MVYSIATYVYIIFLILQVVTLLTFKTDAKYKYTLQESGTNHGHKLVRRNKFYLQNKKSSSSSKKKTHKTDQVYVVKDITFLCFPLSGFRIWSPWTTLAKKTSTSVSQWLSSYYPSRLALGGGLQTVIKSYWVDNWV